MFNWIKDQSKALYIARPDQASNDLVWAHPDRSIPRGAKLTVRSDEIALFFREGQFIGEILPGTVLMDTANIPFLGSLIDQFTGGNQFITELYFCKTSETQIYLEESELGQFTDILSTNLVNLYGGLEYSVVVKDPKALILGIGGQNIYTSDSAIEKLNGRVNNILRSVVGQLSSSNQITDITSGSKTEALAGAVQQKLSEEFLQMGVGLMRIMNLVISLDQESEDLLREFGKQRADLRLQEMGAQAATQEGFAEYNLIQGQRQALEGLGAGMATGNSPILMGGGLGGGGLGANLTTPPRSRVTTQSSSSRSRSGGAAIRGERKFFYVLDGIEQGPVSPRNVALVALSKNISLSDLQVRSEDDAPGDSFAAEYEPLIRDEYNRRKPS